MTAVPHPRGSLGRGDEDNWSDADLLILAGEEFIGRFMIEPEASPWARQPATAKTADEIRQIHLGYVHIAGKYVGRRSPRAGEMIRFLGRRDFNDPDPAVQIRALRGFAEDLSSPAWGQLGDAVACYLDLVEATVQPGPR